MHQTLISLISFSCHLSTFSSHHSFSHSHTQHLNSILVRAVHFRCNFSSLLDSDSTFHREKPPLNTILVRIIPRPSHLSSITDDELFRHNGLEQMNMNVVEVIQFLYDYYKIYASVRFCRHLSQHLNRTLLRITHLLCHCSERLSSRTSLISNWQYFHHALFKIIRLSCIFLTCFKLALFSQIHLHPLNPLLIPIIYLPRDFVSHVPYQSISPPFTDILE